jgi:predicted RNA-binding protein Jag
MSHRFEGHNLEDALNNAAATLGVERYQLTHKILVEKRGFLGGIKRIVIEADVDQNATPPADAPTHPRDDAHFEADPSDPPAYTGPPRTALGPQREPRESRGRGHSGAGGGRGRGGSRRDDRRGGSSGGDARGRGQQHSRREETLEPGDFERFAVEAPEQGPESEAVTSVRGWCEQVLSLAKLSATIRTEENETQIIVRLYGGDSRRFIEQHGELLDAFQVLANKALVGRRVEKDIELDCESFKQRRVSDLEERARALADRVRHDGREHLLPAMSPIERRIVHLTLQDDEAVTTESRGDGFYKRVAVIPRPPAVES